MNDLPTASGPAPLAVDERTAAKMLSISPRALWSIRASGKIKAAKVGARVIYSVEELRRFLADAQEAAR